MAEQERKLYKDWFDRSAAQALADQVKRVRPGFDKPRFIRRATRGLTELEFNARVKQFSDALADGLPDHYPTAVKVLVDSLPAPQVNTDVISDGWLQWPLGQFIADYGVEHFAESMDAMIELTKRFSAEFAVRPFVEHYPQQTFTRLTALTADRNPHVRRWCSEGTRTRLPWGRKLPALIEDPTPVWPILEALKDDTDLYVRRSVANNLNDLAKDHPQAVLALCRRWRKGAGDERQWIIRHALRTLIKDGNPKALALIGYRPPRNLKAELHVKPTRVDRGDAVQLKATIINGGNRPQDLLVDFVVHYVRKNGRFNGKVFKWKTLTVAADSNCAIEKKLSLKATTVRALYAGRHTVDLQVNGVVLAQTHFDLR